MTESRPISSYSQDENEFDSEEDYDSEEEEEDISEFFKPTKIKKQPSVRPLDWNSPSRTNEAYKRRMREREMYDRYEKRREKIESKIKEVLTYIAVIIFVLAIITAVIVMPVLSLTIWKPKTQSFVPSIPNIKTMYHAMLPSSFETSLYHIPK